MPSRRVVLGAGIGGLSLLAGVAVLRGQEVLKDIRDLKPGEFTWHPERSPDGSVAVIVSLPDQRVHVYRNGIRIAVSTCSSGKPGHATPTGVFTILQKDRNHHSSTYNNAPMPNMNRLTWQGIALHAGQLPGYPASHGCVRLPLEFSRRLFDITHIGTVVIIAGSHNDPADLIHPGLVLAGDAKGEVDQAIARLKAAAHPKDAAPDAQPALISVVVSGRDRRVTVLENERVLAEGDATIALPGQPLGEHVYMLRGAEGNGTNLIWHAIVHNADPKEQLVALGSLHRVQTPPNVDAVLKARWHPGLTLVLTDQSASADTRTGTDFVVMSDDVGV